MPGPPKRKYRMNLGSFAVKKKKMKEGKGGAVEEDKVCHSSNDVLTSDAIITPDSI